MTTELVIPACDILGEPTAPMEWVRSHWAVLIDSLVDGVAGPVLLAVQSEADARKRLDVWLRDRPDVNPRLVRRKVTESFGEWEAAQ